MGAVCKKHEEFYEKACRWCVPEEPGLRERLGDKDLSTGIVPKGPSAAAAPPTCSWTLGGGCQEVAAWRWLPVSEPAKRNGEMVYCATHHSENYKHFVAHWQFEKIQ